VHLFVYIILLMRSHRFRWVYCQLQVLRHCLPSSVLRTLKELPKSLDETYERLLKGIKRANQDHALRLLQCLVVAIRPLRVEELAEVLAIDFHDAEGIPKLNPNWRSEDQEQALLAACSSLISIVEDDSSRVVQFSHFSIKEFLTSERLTEDTSHYHVLLEPSHAVLAHACLGVLLPLDSRVRMDGTKDKSPLADYAARCWVNHAQFKNACSHVQKSMECLFDPDKPHFRDWLRLHDRQWFHINPAFVPFILLSKTEATPLYYAALCGFHDLTQHLIASHPQQVNARGGLYVAPLVAALAGNHYPIALLLHEHGADLDVRGENELTPLDSVCQKGHLEIAQWLLSHGAAANTQTGASFSPLHWAAQQGHVVLARILLKYNADAEAQDKSGYTPLHTASSSSHTPDVVRLLLRRGVNVNAQSKNKTTPMHLAADEGKLEVIRRLLKYGANAAAKDGNGKTAFQLASERGHDEVAKMLSRYDGK
jgi:ankyrin repeat protein